MYVCMYVSIPEDMRTPRTGAHAHTNARFIMFRKNCDRSVDAHVADRMRLCAWKALCQSVAVIVTAGSVALCSCERSLSYAPSALLALVCAFEPSCNVHAQLRALSQRSCEFVLTISLTYCFERPLNFCVHLELSRSAHVRL